MLCERTALCEAVGTMVPVLQQQAAADDAAGDFPGDSFHRLRQLGLLRAPLPETLGGLGLGDGATGAAALLRLLALLGKRACRSHGFTRLMSMPCNSSVVTATNP